MTGFESLLCQSCHADCRGLNPVEKEKFRTICEKGHAFFSPVSEKANFPERTGIDKAVFIDNLCAGIEYKRPLPVIPCTKHLHTAGINHGNQKGIRITVRDLRSHGAKGTYGDHRDVRTEGNTFGGRYADTQARVRTGTFAYRHRFEVPVTRPGRSKHLIDKNLQLLGMCVFIGTVFAQRHNGSVTRQRCGAVFRGRFNAKSEGQSGYFFP